MAQVSYGGVINESTIMQLAEEQRKHIEATCRAMPITRMVDYGMRRESAVLAHRLVLEGRPWDLVLEQMAREDETNARTAEDSLLAREAWHAASACLIFAQMGFNADCDRKRYLYREMNRCFERFVSLSEFSASRIEVPYRGSRLFGWHFRSAMGVATQSVIVLGGMSGWSTAYRSMAEALCARGLDCFLVDGPGQGDSRLKGGVYADADVTAGLTRFVDTALEHSPGANIGLWGNSYGGLLAALTAARDPRVRACCINGGPLLTEVPPFRTAQEQLSAMFGRENPDSLADVLSSLGFDGRREQLTCPTLVLEGGADVLVKPGSQSGFLAFNDHPLSRVARWPDGEHTIYNHPAERNMLVGDWFKSALG